MRFNPKFPAAVWCFRPGAVVVAACATMCLLAGVAAAREPWPEQFGAAAGFQVEPLDPDPVMPPAQPSYAWPRPPRPQYVEPAATPQASATTPVQSQFPVQAQYPAPAQVPVQAPMPVAVQAQFPMQGPVPMAAQAPMQSQVPLQAQMPVQPQIPLQAQVPAQAPAQFQAQVPVQAQAQIPVQAQAPAQWPVRPSLAAVPPPTQSVLPTPPVPAAEPAYMPGQEFIVPGSCAPGDDGCPGYRLYAIADALFMGRYSGIVNRPLAFNENTGATVLSTQALQWGFVPGVRAFFGERKPAGCGWEVGYLGLYGLYSSTQAFGPENLIAPGDLGVNANQFNSAELMNVSYASTLQMAEANVFWYDCGRGNRCQGGCSNNGCQPACGPCRCIDWLAGFRFANLAESADFTSTCCDFTETSNYGVGATSNLFGGQVGVRGRKDYCHWACEGWMKVGIAGVWMSQTQSPIIDFDSGLPYRDGSSSSATGLAGFADANASVIYKINRMWGLRAGLNAIWLGNVALAPDQWDFNQTASVTTVNTGSLILLGGNLGAEARW